MVIKNHRNKNKYCLTSSRLWVRNPYSTAAPEDINVLSAQRDYDTFLENEMKNVTLNLASIDAESIFAPNVVIVSDGFDFSKKQHLLKNFAQNKVVIMGTNKSLAKWEKHARMDWYVANNPYKECMSYLPSHNYYPRCIVSSRANPDFIQRYRARLGVVYRYLPVTDNRFSSNCFPVPIFYVDDYRNPICAAISIALRWEVQRLLLFCCDDSFSGNRPGAIQLKNGLYTYEQHNITNGIVDGLAYWMINREHTNIKIGDHSSGAEYKHIPYINETELLGFFE